MGHTQSNKGPAYLQPFLINLASTANNKMSKNKESHKHNTIKGPGIMVQGAYGYISGIQTVEQSSFVVDNGAKAVQGRENRSSNDRSGSGGWSNSQSGNQNGGSFGNFS